MHYSVVYYRTGGWHRSPESWTVKSAAFAYADRLISLGFLAVVAQTDVADAADVAVSEWGIDDEIAHFQGALARVA